MAQEILVFVGTYTRRNTSEGIYVYTLDPDTGELRHVGTAPKVVDPAFLTVGPDGRHLYAVNEVAKTQECDSGTVVAFTFDPQRRTLEVINRQASQGADPCHISVEATGRYALVANYGSGSVCMLPIRADGGLDPVCDLVQHHGSSVNPERQAGPHAHSIFVDPTNSFAFCADLGLDKILCYRLDLEHGKLAPHDVPWTKAAPGAGPRHLAFHPNGRYLYAITEMANTVVVYAYDAAAGTLREVQTISALPQGYCRTSYCADVHVSADGRFLYGSNRGHDSIAVFQIDAGTGQLTPVEYAPCGGKYPRNFGIDPCGRFLLAANGPTNNVVVLRIDPDSGRLVPTGHEAQVPTPVCVKMLAR